MEMQMGRPGMGARSTTMIGSDIAPAQLKAEHILLKRKNQLLLKKEKRIQVSLDFFFVHMRGSSASVWEMRMSG